jgi:predicted transcriptional regulator
MRTTIDLEPDLHRMAQSIARDQHQTLSEIINDLLARVLTPHDSPTFSTSAATGLPTVRLGRVITADDVRQLEDDE